MIAADSRNFIRMCMSYSSKKNKIEIKSLKLILMFSLFVYTSYADVAVKEIKRTIPWYETCLYVEKKQLLIL